MIDHDRLFKELLSTFFLEFLDLFLPEIANTLDRTSIRFLPQEYFADLTTGEDKIIDLLVEVRQSEEAVGFLVHIEAQSSSEANFARRMFFYFARLHQKYLQRIYPIAIFSFDQPQRPESNQYTVELPEFKILEFNYKAIQLNRLNWRDYLNQRNPVAAALMAKMRIAPIDRPRVKVECLRLLATLQLDRARTRLISGFVDTYLRLNAQENQAFQTEIDRLEIREREEIMEIVTSWMEQGIEQGIERGIERGTRSLVLQQLTTLLGELSEPMRSQISELPSDRIQSLSIALLRFQTIDDLEQWLSHQA